jgi:hypothetical protein
MNIKAARMLKRCFGSGTVVFLRVKLAERDRGVDVPPLVPREFLHGDERGIGPATFPQ